MCNSLTDVSASAPPDVDAKAEDMDMDIGGTPQAPDPAIRAKAAEVTQALLSTQCRAF